MMQRHPRIHNEAHLAFIRTLPCLLTREDTTVEACHIRYTDFRIDKHNAGVGAKPDDIFVVPLSGEMHRQQHSFGDERKFWKAYNIDPVFYALALYAFSGDHERCSHFVSNARTLAMANSLANIMSAG